MVRGPTFGGRALPSGAIRAGRGFLGLAGAAPVVPSVPSGLEATLRGTATVLDADLVLGTPVGIVLPSVSSGTLVSFHDFTDESFESGRSATDLTVLDRSGNGFHVSVSGAGYVPVGDTALLGAGKRGLLWDTLTAGAVLTNSAYDTAIAANAVGATVITAVRWENTGNNVDLGQIGRVRRIGESGSLNRTGLVVGFSAGINVTATWAGSSQNSNATQNAIGNGTHVLASRAGINPAVTELRTNDTITNAAGATSQNITTTGGLNLQLGGAWRNTGSLTPRQVLVASVVYAGRLSDPDLAAVRAVLATAANVSITV